ncbi:POK7 protein, partial [Pelecanoides urinatrix]|nr:POK7 protein [Pelecanoides urinatrix]
VELYAVICAFQLFPDALNIVSDSAYVTGLVTRLEHSYLKHVSNPTLFAYCLQLQSLLNHRSNFYYITHIRSHTGLPGVLAEGNARADQIAAANPAVVVFPDILQQAYMSHAFFHQSAQALIRTFHITHAQAKSILQMCPDCQDSTATGFYGINP